MLSYSILKFFGQFWGISKNIENQNRLQINRVFENKIVQFSGLPFRFQEIAKKLTKNRKNWTKA